MSNEIEEFDEDDNYVTIYDKLEEIETCGILHLKGYKTSEIVQHTGLNPREIRNNIKEFDAMMKKRALNEPHYLDQTNYHTFRAEGELQEVKKELWESVEIASQHAMVSARNQALKTILDAIKVQGQITQVIGGSGTDAEYINRMQKAEMVNQIVSEIIRDIVSDCERCSALAKDQLRKAFMNMESNERTDLNEEE